MTVDSAVTLDFGDSRKYTLGRKSYFYPGVGCITTWGSRDHNRIGEYLENHNITPENHSIENLSELVYEYLTKEYRPHELGFDDVGYHVAGFNNEGQAKLFHVFWGFDRPRPPEQTDRKYEIYNHSPAENGIQFLYNGRNDLAHTVVHTLLYHLGNNYETRFNLGNPVDIACFSDFVTRFGAELTPEIGPPFLTFLISPQNNALRMRNDSFCPLDRESVTKALRDFGYAV